MLLSIGSEESFRRIEEDDSLDQNSFIEVAVIFSTRLELREAIKSELKELKFKDIVVSLSQDEIINHVKNNKNVLLITEWETEEGKVKELFENLAENFLIEGLPILMFARSLSADVTACGFEFGVAKLQVGDISRNLIRKTISEISVAVSADAPLRGVIKEVSDFRKNGDWTSSREVLEKIWKENPKNYKIAAELAENYFNEGRFQEAVDILDPFLDLDPPNVRILHLAGRSSMKLGEFEKASDYFKVAKLLNPLKLDRLISLGNCYLNLDKPEEAREIFDEALGLDPSSKDATVGKSKATLLEGDVNSGLKMVQEVSSPKELASIFNSTAIISMRFEKFREGLRLYDTAIQAVKSDEKLLARLLFNKGLGYLRWKRMADAADCFKSAHFLDKSFEKAKRNYEKHLKWLKGSKEPIPPDPDAENEIDAKNEESLEEV